MRDPLNTGHESYGLFSRYYNILLPDLQIVFPEKNKNYLIYEKSYEIFVQEKPEMTFNVP